MPGENVQSWSVTAADNGNSDTSIDWREGQTRASVNNSARSMMAAHAKDRNLKNGSIVTTGAANAQAFVSGLTYTSIPTGLVVKLKIGYGLTNDASTTLNMDGIGAVTIKTDDGLDIKGGELVAGSYTDFLWDGTNWIFLYSREFLQNLIEGGDGIVLSQQVFATAGTFTYTPSAGMACCIIECIGGGGGGGGATVNLSTEYMVGGGGGAGAYRRVLKTATDVGASQALTVGVGGTAGVAGGPTGNGGDGGISSVGTLCAANGGGGGLGASSGQVGQGGQGGAAAADVPGEVNVPGAAGESGVYNNNTSGVYIYSSGTGAASVLGGGSQAFANSPAHTGFAGSNYGSGGGGGSLYGNASGPNVNGGAGSAGVVIVTEFAGRGTPGQNGLDGAAGPIGPVGPSGPGTGDVLRAGVPTAGQIAQWTDASHIQGVPLASLIPPPVDTSLQNIRVFTASGTYPTTSATIKVLVMCKGAGGGGGGSADTIFGGGGGEGAISWKLTTAAALSGQTVTIGDGGVGTGTGNGTVGGTSSIGSIVTAPGGGAGLRGDTTLGVPGAGGNGGTRDWGEPGIPGQGGGVALAVTSGGGRGGGTVRGNGIANSGGGGAGSDSSAFGGGGGSGIIVCYEYGAI
jgi:hypothetical protein